VGRVVSDFGDIVLAAGGLYSSKPRPVLVFQNNAWPTGESTIVIPLTSRDSPFAHYRVAVAPTPGNGLDRPCQLEIDKAGAIRTAWLGRTLGHLEPGVLQASLDLARRLMSPDPGTTQAP
jgi:mRNA interferase MazF